MPDEEELLKIEKAKLAVDVMKHLATLSSGVILLIVALHDKGTIPPGAAILAAKLIVASLSLSLTYLFVVAFTKMKDTELWPMILLAFLSLAAFAGGIGFLSDIAAIYF